MLLAVRGLSGLWGDKHCFRLIQPVREECKVLPAGCSSNNSRVAEVHVCGSYARGHITLLCFLVRRTVYANTVFSQQGEDWRLIRCMCGALSGRCQDYVTESGEPTTVYRLVKYAIRPVSPSAEYVFHMTWRSVSWLIGLYTIGRAGYRSLHLLSKIWQNSHVLMRHIDL